MKSEKGITLFSLIVYVTMLLTITALVGTVSTYFYKNINNINEDSKYVSSYNKFNMFFLEVVKKENNKVDQISDDKNSISFKSGDSFIFKNNSIYLNGVKICGEVQKVEYKLAKEESEAQPEEPAAEAEPTDSTDPTDPTGSEITLNNENVVVVDLTIGKNSPYTRTMKYVLESSSTI